MGNATFVSMGIPRYRVATGRIAPVVVLMLLAGRASAGGVRHVPPADTAAGGDFAVTAEVARASERTMYLRYRSIGAVSWHTAEFARAEDNRWVAIVPAAQIIPPGVEYFIASVGDKGSDEPEFASAEAPHRVSVLTTERELRRGRDLARARHRRSRAHVSSEYVSYGARHSQPSGASIADHYYRVDADFSYRLLAYPLEEIRFGYTRLEGAVPNAPLTVPSACNGDPDSETCRLDAGFKVGGWFELGLALVEGVRFDVRGIFMANQEGFAVGTRAELRTGVSDGNHVAMGGDYMADVGATGFFRLGWETVPRVAMAMTVEVTDLPASVRATGVRLLYDVFVPFPNGLRIGARIGYAARDQQIGGPAAGLGASVDF